MAVIQSKDVIDSIYQAFQYISYYHSKDFIDAMQQAYELEESPAAKDALVQILVNSRLCAEGKRPICQDTGIAVVFVKVGMNVQWQGDMSLEDMINEGVRKAYTDVHNKLRASVLNDPAGTRANTGDNTPAVIHYEVVEGDTVEFKVAAKGGGSENKAKLAMLKPSDSIEDWIIETIPTLGAGWCPPGVLGVGIGGTPEKAMMLAKESLLEEINIQNLRARGAETTAEKLRVSLHDKINQLGIGAQGLGGLTTVMDVKVKDYPTHAASLPVAIIPNCAATRHTHFTLDGSGPAELPEVSLSDWPDISYQASDQSRRVDVDSIQASDVLEWKAGETILLSGKILTGRDAAHKKMVDMIANGEELPVSLDNRFIYYVGPVDPVADEVVGPAGPTTSTRMDKFSEVLFDNTKLLGMIGKAERGSTTIDLIGKHQLVYLSAVGGAAYLVSKAIQSAKVLAFEELGMEAIYEFEVKDMPLMVAVDSQGSSVHTEGPKKWQRVDFS